MKLRHVKLPALAPVLLFLVVLPATATQQRSFVSANGSDTNLCTRDSPCRNFTAAIAQTSANGEVVALDSAGYGSAVITQPVTLVAPPGVHAAISVFTGIGISVNVNGSGTVVLRNLYINGQGGTTGVELQNATALHIEHCVINGVNSNGVNLASTVAPTFVRDTVVRHCGGSGIYIDGGVGGGNGPLLSVSNCVLDANQFGLGADHARVSARDTIASANTDIGFYARGNSGDSPVC